MVFLFVYCGRMNGYLNDSLEIMVILQMFIYEQIFVKVLRNFVGVLLVFFTALYNDQ